MSKLAILDSNFTNAVAIDDVVTASFFERINADNVLTFEPPYKSEYIEQIIGDKVIQMGADYYDICFFEKGQSNNELVMRVECEHISYRLNEDTVEFFTEIGTPTQILTKLLTGTIFTVGTVEFTETITYSLQEKMSKRLLLVDFAKYLGGELAFNGFEISIVARRGSATSKDLLANKDLEVINMTYDKRTLTDEGNPKVCYACQLIEPIDVNLGDNVILNYGTLGIDVDLRVVSINKDPYNKYFAEFEIGNYVSGLEDEARRIETSTLVKGKKYYGARISPEFGFESIRNDKFARGVFNADEIALQVGDGSGDFWENVLYFDAVNRKFIFDGELSANVVNILNTLITPNFTAGKATIAELTVDQLDTSDKVQNYLLKDTDFAASIADVNYIKIQNEVIEFITATTDGLSEEQAVNRNSEPLWWTDDTYSGSSTTETLFPVMIYVYEELTKMKINFSLLNDGNYSPIIEVGAGTGTGDNGKAKIYKDSTSFNIDYKSSTGDLRQIKFNDAGISFVPDLGTGGGGGGSVYAPTLEELWIGSTSFSGKYDGIVYTTGIERDSMGRINKLITGGIEIPINYS